MSNDGAGFVRGQGSRRERGVSTFAFCAACGLRLGLADGFGEKTASGADEFVAQFDGEDEAVGFEDVEALADFVGFGVHGVSPFGEALA
jgi:hypothetical protein